VKVFISWSGTRSRETAKLLRGWLKQVINEIEPWMSDEDLAKGGDWSGDITNQLNAAEFGIICVTPGNMDRPWLLFEAGALSRQVNNVASRVAPLLIGFNSKSDVPYPLGRFQATEPTKADMLKLIKSLNDACLAPREAAELETAFEVWWPHFEAPFKVIEETKPMSLTSRIRPEGEVLDEVLSIVRTLQKQSAPRPQRVASTSTRETLSGTGTLIDLVGLEAQLHRKDIDIGTQRLQEALRQVTDIVGAQGMTVSDVAANRDADRPIVVIGGGLHLTPDALASLRERLRPFSVELDMRFDLDDGSAAATRR
jgi:TIR domain